MSRRSVPREFHRPVRLVAIGASAGGVEALLSLLPALPADFPACIAVVIHVPPDRDSLLTEVFSRRCAMRVAEAEDKAPLAPGTIHFAPAGYHLLVEPDATFSLSCDALVHYSRPSIDVLFESAADALGSELAALLLTGANEDGARGLARAGAAGALTVVQDPATAQSADMPRAALDLFDPDFILPLNKMPALMERLAAHP